MGGEQDVFALFQAKALVYVAGLDFLEILVQNLGHRAAGDIGAFLGQAAVGKIAARVLAVGHVHVGNDIHDAAVGLFGQALILAAVAGLHVEDGDVEPLGADDAEAGISVAQHQHGVGLHLHHQLVALGDYVAHRLAQVLAHGLHINVGVGELQVLEEHAVEVIVVVLPGVCQQAVEVLTALVYDCRQTDDFRTCAHDDQKLQLPVIFKLCHILFNIRFFASPFGKIRAGFRMTVIEQFAVIWAYRLTIRGQCPSVHHIRTQSTAERTPTPEGIRVHPEWVPPTFLPTQ